MATPDLASAMQQMKVTVTNGAYDLVKMSKEQWIKFRFYFIEERMKSPLWI
jgi:hypothetical protein